MTNPSVCHYGVLARLYVDEDEWAEDEQLSKSCFKSSKKAPYRTDKDLLLALGESHLFALRRRQQRTRACVCMSPSELTLDCSTQQRLASEFQCPHVHLYDDYEQWAAIGYSDILQVQLTFRTVAASGQNNGLAARTKDLMVVVKGGSKLWVEFEHNLGRGAFLDALMAASAPHVTLDLDYTDLAKPNNQSEKPSEVSPKDPPAEPSWEQVSPRMVFEFQRAASRLAVMLALEIDAEDLDVALYGETEHKAASTGGLASSYTASNQPFLSFEFRREALRRAIETRVQLALQLSSEVELDNPYCHFLLGTAMELSRVLDEPDLYALTWLASGFINLQRALLATPVGSTKLVQSQLEHAIKIAREHSLRLQLALSLACCGDLHRLTTQQIATARLLLVEAARLMPTNTLDVVGKMQLHNNIHQLGLALSPRTESDTQDKNVVDLWKALSTALTPTSNRVEQYPLLRPVVKSSIERSRYCFVEVHAVTAAETVTPKLLRLRVYFTEHSTFEWLRGEITQRCTAVPMHELGDEEDQPTVAEVVGFYDSTKKNQPMIPWNSRMVDVVRVDWHILQAVVHQTVRLETDSPEVSPGPSLRTSRPTIVMVRCSKCRQQMKLKDVEVHSESCS
ncbi:hypothetical protein PR003_g26260 [Phytophthora rubi]|uniref:Uncharacterized protein n=1 Tax=Phytophthora rubi TaxID=129364 RepID=A0A6A3J9X0_9STRA|nr:hypothetical protein PR002_g25404 [Phytophthora rubi]KAE8991450.1 hypothetical protein PR001_g21223 [Phytophthora rubi]KAE9286655.1 hypothetical protein PR003_g26260 [Phytophthora rubi]